MENFTKTLKNIGNMGTCKALLKSHRKQLKTQRKNKKRTPNTLENPRKTFEHIGKLKEQKKLGQCQKTLKTQRKIESAL